MPVPQISLPRPIRLASMLVAAAVVLAAVDALEALLGWRQVNAGADAFIRLMYDPEQGRQVVANLRDALHDNIVISLVVAILLLPLAFALRRPYRRVRVIMWVVPVVAWAVLGCALATGPEITSYSGGVRDDAAARAWADLMPAWYNSVHAVTVFLILAALTAAALLLTKHELVEFYNRSDPPDDSADRWSHLRRDDTRSA